MCASGRPPTSALSRDPHSEEPAAIASNLLLSVRRRTPHPSLSSSRRPEAGPSSRGRRARNLRSKLTHKSGEMTLVQSTRPKLHVKENQVTKRARTAMRSAVLVLAGAAVASAFTAVPMARYCPDPFPPRALAQIPARIRAETPAGREMGAGGFAIFGRTEPRWRGDGCRCIAEKSRVLSDGFEAGDADSTGLSVAVALGEGI